MNVCKVPDMCKDMEYKYITEDSKTRVYLSVVREFNEAEYEKYYIHKKKEKVRKRILFIARALKYALPVLASTILYNMLSNKLYLERGSHEIKSCKEDIYSGNGLNFIGEKNYLVTTMECYKEILPDLKNGKFAKHIRENFPECYAEIGNMGVMVAVPYQREVAEEFENSTPLDGDVEKWKLSVAIKCNHNGSRKRSMTELLFCMVRSGR